MRVAIVGAGYSGTVAALELGRAAPGARIALIEKGERFAAGTAYGTTDPGHLLNVRARNMSAFAGEPDDFADWAGARGFGPDDYVPRRLYGAYLSERLAAAPDVERVHGEAVAVEADGLRLASGDRVPCGVAILAGGNYPSRLGGPAGARALHDPWSEEGRAAVGATAGRGGDVLLVGTGLTMIDLCVSLEEAGFEGRITACSRRGLVPRAHVAPPPAPEAWQPPERLEALIRALRQREPWRSAVDGLRPHSVALWRGFDEAERRRFLRHLRPWWDVHRHRIAPAVAARIEHMQREGRLEIVAGRIVGAGENGEVTIALRGSGGEMRRTFGLAVNCTGPEGDIRRVGDPLIRQLLASGLARPDPLNLGLDVDAGSRVIGEGPAPALYALGPLTKGAFWEMVAVPDIRGQARGVAEAIAAL